jgi:hypothetical protein
MRRSVYTRTLERAAEMLGGEQALAEYLNVPPRRLDWWLRGDTELPTEIFLQLVDLLLENGFAQLKKEVPRTAAQIEASEAGHYISTTEKPRSALMRARRDSK